MSATAKKTVVFRENGVYRRLCKLIIGGDGSYYVTAPYHVKGKACLFKMTMNYDTGTVCDFSFDETFDVSSLDDARLKLSHHPDGFVQYSGDGVLSGRDESGNVRGMGVISSPLQRIFDGPAFSLGVQGTDQLETLDQAPKNSLSFDVDSMPSVAGSNGIALEVHYFPPSWRRFVRQDGCGRPIISIQHPVGANLELLVMLSGDDCAYPGLLGIEIHRQVFSFPESGFTLCGPGGYMRLNEHHQHVADCLFCIHPHLPQVAIERALNFPVGRQRV